MAYDPVNLFVSLLQGVKSVGTERWMARCPAHDDNKASLSVLRGAKGQVVFYCHAGCTFEKVLTKLGLELKDLFPTVFVGDGLQSEIVKNYVRSNGQAGKKSVGKKSYEVRKVIGTYVYEDAYGKPLFRVCRTNPKGFFQQQPANDGSWVNGTAGVNKVPYCLPKMLNAAPSSTVYIVEGEKDVNRLRKLGAIATCNAGGASKWDNSLSQWFDGLHVKIIPDNDDPGRKHAEAIARSIHSIALSVTIIKLDLPIGGDISDWLDAGHELLELVRISEYNPQWIPTPAIGADYARACEIMTPPVPTGPKAPVLSDGAFHGLAGEIVREIEPHSEADPAALLLQLLVAYGTLINRNSYFHVEADRHHGNLFVVLVGQTAKGRKGTSWGHIRKFPAKTDPEWAKERILGGLSSGEGLIASVANQTNGNGNGNGRSKDKRILVYESEFARVLKQSDRSGNILSQVLRQAWDGNSLQTLTKQTPLRADNAHISIIAHVTRDDLKRYLCDTDSANGFGNRFLWVSVTRSKVLPEGGNINVDELSLLQERFTEAVMFGQDDRDVRRDEAARKLWCEKYTKLSEGQPGLAGALIARSEAQVTRLSLLFALLDHANVVRKEHLIAALHVWQYCQDSVYYIFGNDLGDPVADEIISALERVVPNGLTRTEIYNLFKRHRKAADISQALVKLHELGRVVFSRSSETGGRPVETWTLVEKPAQ